MRPFRCHRTYGFSVIFTVRQVIDAARFHVDFVGGGVFGSDVSGAGGFVSLFADLH